MNPQFTAAKQMIDVQKATFDGMINSMIMVWEQTSAMLESATWIPEEGRKAFRQWVEINKQGCVSLKGAVDSGYSNLERFFTGTGSQEQSYAA